MSRNCKKFVKYHDGLGCFLFTFLQSFATLWFIMSLYNLEQIKEFLPHRYPFLFIDEVIECDNTENIVAQKMISSDEFYFQGHFPGNPIMPGVIQVETIAQTAGILTIILARAKGLDALPLLTSVERTKFRKVVRPGDALRIEARLMRIWGMTGKFSGRILVEGKMTCETELMCAMMPKN